jgi:hypothetical protein
MSNLKHGEIESHDIKFASFLTILVNDLIFILSLHVSIPVFALKRHHHGFTSRYTLHL